MVLFPIFEQPWIGCSCTRPRAIHLRRVPSFKSSPRFQGYTALPHSGVALPPLVRQLYISHYLGFIVQIALLTIFAVLDSHGSKTPSVLARVQLAMFFDYLYFKPSDNIMTVEPAILLMVRNDLRIFAVCLQYRLRFAVVSWFPR